MKGLRHPNRFDAVSIVLYVVAALWMGHYGVPFWARIGLFALIVLAASIAQEGNS